MDKKRSRTRFLLVKHDCGNEQYVFDNAKRNVLCLMCRKPIAQPTGGFANILGKVMKAV